MVFWTCTKLEGFWTQVSETIKQFTDFDLGLDPANYLLLISQNLILVHYLNAARDCVPTLWNKDSPSTHSLWFTKIDKINSIENITATLRGKDEKF